MSKVVLVVTLTIAPRKRDAFLERVGKHAAICLDKEPGCLAFDVLVPEEEPDMVLLHEVYADEEAVEHHLASSHMQAYLADTGPWIVERHRHVCSLQAN